MTEIELEPRLSACIQTLAKREYHRAMEALLATEEERPDLLERVETLRIFLESTDFARLRSEYEPYLAEGRRVKFTLRPGRDRAEYRMDVS